MERKLQIQDIKNYDNLLDIVYDNEELIERAYNSINEQTLIHETLLIKIVDFLQNIDFNKKEISEAIELLFRDILELNDTDTVLIKESYIFIKEKKTEKLPKINVEELESFYKSSFSGNDVEELLYDIAEEFVQSYFIDSHITNSEYERIGFKLIQQLIAQDLEKDFLCEKTFYIIFSEFIFNKNSKISLYSFCQFL